MADLNPNPTVEVIHPERAIVAEGPYYEEETNTLMWVDIIKCTLNFLDVGTLKNRALEYSEPVSAVLPIEGSTSQVIVLLKRKICVVDRESGAVVSVLDEVETDKPASRFNDAKCDSSGRLWCGTMPPETSPGILEPDIAGLYCHSAGTTKKQAVVSLSNGIAWNKDDNIMYYIDSFPKKVYSFSYNKQEGSVSNQEVLLDYCQDDIGIPDGMTIDTKGRLWVASYFGQRVTCWDPQTKETVLTVKIPGARRITSCCFGGPNYEWLFVTSSSINATEEELSEYPNSGYLFIIKDLGAQGSPANKFKLN